MKIQVNSVGDKLKVCRWKPRAGWWVGGLLQRLGQQKQFISRTCNKRIYFVLLFNYKLE